MSTGVETWANVSELGPVYPFVGTEGLMFIICLSLWIVWHIWQLRNEAKEFSVEHEELKDKAKTAKVLESRER